ncbi:SusC/RagA family TonB-linked outer membrane protein [Sphingobacterium sp. Mn56C]|uniref:SusC/RagA family TonB-linked outer membrane protein n=1 Tax=Sphingobacterium sp. Mn56C TaxID=3395261 RepID=UPI003BDF7F58
MNRIYLRSVAYSSALLLGCSLLFISTTGYSQTITLKGNRIPFTRVINTIREQSGYSIFGPKQLLDEAGLLSLDVKDMPLTEFLRKITSEKNLDFVIEDKTISLSQRAAKVAPSVSATPQLQQRRTLTGQVVNTSTQQPIAGATVTLNTENTTITTDSKGRFVLTFTPTAATPVLLVSFVGMKKKEVAVNSQNSQNNLFIGLEENIETIKDAIVTGIYQRTKESFTGSATTYTIQELKMVGNQNVLQSLKTLDPSFAIIENTTFGANPNRLPDIEIRGKSSVIGLNDQYGANPNQPLFILDGFESSLSVINDISMDRIASITILKDAASTAIYGSKAANGVVVVETKRPTPGQLKVTYNLNGSVAFADLSDYNLMNAAEKLQYERLSGFYGRLDAHGNISNDDGEATYNQRMQEVARGVNTFWASEPLRTALVQRHTIAAEGGDQNLTYSGTVSYSDNPGVMKLSSRGITSGNMRLLYRKNNISFNNSLSIDYLNTNEEPVAYAQFVRANPYHRKYNVWGGIDKLMESFTYVDNAFVNKTQNIYNPLYDMKNNNVNRGTSVGFTNNFELEWSIQKALRLRTRLSVRSVTDKTEKFRSPFNSEFVNTDVLYQGTYSESNGRQMTYDGDLALTYGKLIHNLHLVNIVVGGRAEQTANAISMYQVQGFVDDDFSNPAFAFGYERDGRPLYKKDIRRAASFFLNSGYSFNGRYLIDATLRLDGSSVFGTSKQFTHIWSLGLGWNAHNERFFRDIFDDKINYLKLRASVGNPGNQNFTDYISTRVYRYNYENRNPFGSSVILDNFGNKDLKWQKTVDKNIGLDVELLKSRLRFNVDYFHKDTDPLLIAIGLPSSTGTNSMPSNLGAQTTKGLTVQANYALIQQKEFIWRINMNLRKLQAKYRNIGNSLDSYNKNNTSRNLVRYYDGASPSDLWAVRSLGIDPATGREVFLTKDNQQTFVHNYADEVVVGNVDPKVEGIIGTSFYYRGFSAAINLRYRLGGQTFMQTLYEKVENISIQDASLNQDKRALTDRWKKPGDVAKFKAISNTVSTPMSSRFVEDNNILAGESFSLGYEAGDQKWLRTIGASSLNFRVYMNDIFRISTVKNERGIDYPFARSVSFSLGLRF